MTVQIQIFFDIILLCIGFIFGGVVATNVKRKEHIKEIDEIISETENAYNKIKKERDDYKKARDQVLIIHGIEEGAENWKAEYDNCRAILQILVELKRVKDVHGKNEFYEKQQPIAWEAAKRFLEKYTHL